MQLAANEIHDGRFLAAAAGNRHHLHDERERFGVADRIVESFALDMVSAICKLNWTCRRAQLDGRIADKSSALFACIAALGVNE